MEMIDVLKKLEEIAQTRPELVRDAVDNVSRTNPTDVVQNSVQSEPSLKTDEGGMSDVHIGAQEVVGEYTDEDGNLKMPKAEVLQAMAQAKATAAFPLSYEIETAMKTVQDKFDDAGQSQENSPAFPSYTDGQEESAVPTQEPEALEGNEFSQAVQQAKASGMKKGDKFKVGDEEHTLRDSDFEGENTRDMKTENKPIVKEAVQISTDTPEEASMMMQLLKLAGVQQVDQDMISQEPEADAGHGCGPSCAEHGCNCEHGQAGQDDAIGSGEMAKLRDMMTAPAEEKAEETFDNEPEEKVSDIDTLVNVHSGGLNRKKQAFAKAQDGDNAMAVEDTITSESLANSFREQYEAFKEAYQKEAKIAEAKPDFLDMDKDGDKKEPMKKAIKDKEAK